MKKSLLCLAAVFAVALTLPAAVFASGIQSGAAVYTAELSEDSDIWFPATEEILAEEAMITAAAASDPSIILDDENPSGAGAGFAPMATTTNSIGASRYSSTSGNVSAYASFDRKATSASCTIILQERYNGAWRNATGVPVKIYRKTTTDSYSISAARTFTLVKGKVYRAKIRFVDTNSTGTYYKTRYTGSF